MDKELDPIPFRLTPAEQDYAEWIAKQLEKNRRKCNERDASNKRRN